MMLAEAKQAVVTNLTTSFFEADGARVCVMGHRATYSDGSQVMGLNWELLKISDLVDDDARRETARLVASALNSHVPAIAAINLFAPKIGDPK